MGCITKSRIYEPDRAAQRLHRWLFGQMRGAPLAISGIADEDAFYALETGCKRVHAAPNRTGAYNLACEAALILERA